MHRYDCLKGPGRALFFMFLTMIFAACVSQPEPQENSLVRMVRNRDIDGVKARFDTGEINAIDDDGQSLLHIAARQNDERMTEYLLSMGAQKEALDPTGNTPLLTAADANAFKAAQVLARHNAYLFAANADGESAFQRFNEKKQLPILLNPQTVLQKDEYGTSLLHYAAAQLDENLVRVLLAAAGDSLQTMIDEPDDDGRTALEIVYARPEEKSAAAIAALLLHAGAAPLNREFAAFETATVQRNYTMRFTEEQTALHIAAAAGYTGFVQFMLEQGCPADITSSANATPLHEAVRNGHVGAAAALLDAGADPNAAAALGNTALHFAVTAPHRDELISLLLAKKANPAVKDGYGETPLHIAVRVGAETDALRALVKGGAVVDERNKKGETPLLLAVERERKELVSLLMSGGADMHAEDTGGRTPFVEAVRQHRALIGNLVTKKTSAQRDSKGRNALHLAILLKADSKVIEYLIKQKTAVNAGDKAGNTPVHYAVSNNRKIAGTLLLANGGDIFATNKPGESPLKIAFTKLGGRAEWLLTTETVALADGNGDTPLHYAALWGMDTMIPFILSQGGNINAKNVKGETPLFTAVKANNARTVKTLCEAAGDTPFDLGARDVMGNTALHAAIGWNAPEAAEAVLRYTGSDGDALLNAKNTAGKTVLHIAAQKGSLPFLTLFLEKHADSNSDDATGKTPLVEAIRYGKTAAVMLLLKYGASPARQDIQGRTALHEAVGLAPVSVITALRTAGADPLIRDSYGVTPISRAFRLGRNILDAALGNEPSLSNSDGETPLHIAVQEQVPEETMRYLISKKYPLDKRDKTGCSALLLAAQQKTNALCTVLLEAGADPFCENNAGESAVSIACVDNTELLAAVRNAAAGKTDAAGNTFAHYAARYAAAETVQALQSALQPYLTQKNFAGDTPADVATRWQRPEIAALLHTHE